VTWLHIIRRGFTVGARDVETFWPNWRIWTGTHVLRVTTTAAMWILLGRMIGSPDVVQFLLIGQIAVVGPQFAGWTVQSFTWDRMFSGCYPLQIAAPSSLVPIMVGRTMVWPLCGMATSLATLVVLGPIFQLAATPMALLWMVPALAVLSLSTYGFAFCVGSLVSCVPKWRNILHNALFIVITAICGVVVPSDFWPAWVQAAASGLPITHGLLAIRTLVADGMSDAVVRGLVTELVVGSIWFVVGTITLDATVRVARRTGAVDLM
jgi:ABC-2 type transport system permease protein